MINEEIRAKELRVIDTDGSQLGIMSRQEVLDISEERKLDLYAFHLGKPACLQDSRLRKV